MAKNDTDPKLSETALIVHEFQSPLTILRMSLESALREPWCSGDCEKLIRECAAEVQNLNQMVVNLLLLEKSEAGRLHGNSVPFDLARLVLRVGERFKTVADSRGVRLSVTTEDRLPAAADEDQIDQVLVNLLDNAFKFTPPGGFIEIEARRIDSTTIVRVVDTGIGIPREDSSRIFGRFYQIDKEKSRVVGGIGLGLSIARALAMQNGGTIDVESTPGKGSCFTLKLSAKESLFTRP